ncbi:LacI family DNA-binding transcriptional regulator [Vibrio atypicus]|uniref:LacI family DNA-binding transcriptional regulator n=1 Tax=Vibrio atypicus TaxID=558271 RepID=UPI001356AF8B|nr:LacI family DNA-binding transcriptional regulator [Vibrio atypicus]
MARIKDVAELAGVNRSTVSRIINGEGKFKEETRRKVEEAMKALDYRPSAIARSLATSSSNMVGLLVTYYTGGFFGTMMDQVQSELDQHKKFLITAQGHHSADGEKEAIQRFNDLRCDGYVLHSRYLSDQELLTLSKAPTPFVLLDRYVPGLEARSITFDHAKASRLAVKHLLENGHTKIACISGPSQRENSLLRKQGYLDEMQDADIAVKDTWCAEGDYGRQSGYVAAQRILEAAPEITAIFSCSEEMTVGALQYLHEAGIEVPNQISIISFDSIDRCADLYPTVTSVHFPISDMARTAALKLSHMIAKTDITMSSQFEPQLKIRHSLKVMR